MSIKLKAALGYLAAVLIPPLFGGRRSERVREAEERYRSLVELAPDGIGVSEQNGKIVFANTALARLVGAASAGELIGRSTHDFVHPDYRNGFEKRKALLDSGREAPWTVAKWVKLDGTSVAVETAGVPVRKDGKILYQGFIRDLTERIQAETRLDESRRRLQALFDTAIDTILFFDSEGRHIDANPAATALLGYTREELVHSSIGDLSTAENCTETMKVFRDILAAGTATGEAVILRKDGSQREIEYRTVANVLDGLHVVMMRDITPRKQAERSLQQLSGRLLRLQDEERRRIALQLHDTTAQNLAALRLNLSRMSRLATDPATNSLLDESAALTDQSIAEVRTLSYVLHPPLIDQAGLLPTLRWYVKGFQERSGISVTLDAPEELDRLAPERETTLFRIVQEALTNVQRHSGSAVARIRLEREPERVRLKIEDEGRGIPEHLRSDEEALAASGVGIAGIRERVRELGGQMQIESQNRGTSLVVTFPISRP